MLDSISSVTARYPRLPLPVLERISEITADLGVLMIGSVVIPAMFDKGSPTMIASGLAIAIILWIISLSIIWRKK